MTADIEVAVAENLNARKSPSGIAQKENSTPITAVRPAVGDHCCRAGAGAYTEDRFTEPCAARRSAVAGDRCAPGVGCILETHAAAACTADHAAVVGNRRAARSGGVEKFLAAA